MLAHFARRPLLLSLLSATAAFAQTAPSTADCFRQPASEGNRALPVGNGRLGAMVFAGDVPRAHVLFGRTMMGVPYEQMKCQSLGDLLIAFPGHDSVTSSRRELLLDSAVARVADPTWTLRGPKAARRRRDPGACHAEVPHSGGGNRHDHVSWAASARGAARGRDDRVRRDGGAQLQSGVQS